jgi:uncharacterized cupin superfamily protein
MPPILNVADIALTQQSHGENFAARMGQFGPRLGMKQLGCRLTVVPPGKRAWPYHSHHANEELFYILEGEGTLRYGGAEHPVRPGDVIACPAGGLETAHQLINTGDADLRYLALSTTIQPEVCEYPDSGKFTVMVGSPPGGDKAARRRMYCGREETGLDYWDGE